MNGEFLNIYYGFTLVLLATQDASNQIYLMTFVIITQDKRIHGYFL